MVVTVMIVTTLSLCQYKIFVFIGMLVLDSVVCSLLGGVKFGVLNKFGNDGI